MNALSSVDWDDLRIVLAIAEEPSLREAAARLQLSASTLSRRLAALEEDLGVELFERHPTGLKLTRAGSLTAELGEHLGDTVRSWRSQIAYEAEEIAGELNITCAEVIGQMTARAIACLLREHPRLSVRWSASDAMASIERHEVDIALRVADSPQEGLIGRRLGRCSVGLFAAQSYLEQQPAPFSEEGHLFVDWPEAVQHKPAFAWLNTHFPRRRVVARGQSAGGVQELIRAGLGIGLLTMAQGNSSKDLVCVQRLPASCSTSLWLLSAPTCQRSARHQAALDVLARFFYERRAEWDT